MEAAERIGTGARWSADAVALALVLAVFVASRVVADRIGIAPDPDVVVHHWQNLSLRSLADDLAGTLAGLRSQPPLWNALLGLGARACDADPACTAGTILSANRAATLLGLLILFAVLRRVGLSARTAGFVVAVAVLTPTVVFYETYAFYPHLTALFALVTVAGLVTLAARPSPLGLAASIGGVAGLSLTVTLWHPAFVALFGAGLVAALPRSLRRPGAAVVLAASLVAVLPAAKNAALFGHFAGGTWGGLNLAQVAPGLTPEERWACSFDRLLAEGSLGSGPPEGEILNRAETAEASSACVAIALRAIAARPSEWIGGIGERLAASHLRAPYHYFFRPIGFDRWPQVPAPETLAAPGGPSPTTVVLLALGLLYYPVVAAGAAWLALRHRCRGPGLVAAAGLALILWQTILSHAANWGEQQRMRYTLEPVYLVLAVMLVSEARGRIRSRDPGRAA